MSKPLYEKYRPATLDEVVGQPAAVAKLRRFVERGDVAGRAFWLSGRSGSGKTTLARILATTVSDPLFVEELDATDLTLNRLRQITHSHRIRPILGGGHAVIVNEAHALKDATRLLGVLESIGPHVVWLFTTTFSGQQRFSGMEDSNALMSRCIQIKLAVSGVTEAFALLAQQIAQAEGLDGKPLDSYINRVEQARGNLRAVLQAIEAGEFLA